MIAAVLALAAILVPGTPPARAILNRHCLECHSAAKASGGVRLDGAIDAVLARRIAAAVRYDGPIKMPPSGKLPAAAIAALAPPTAGAARPGWAFQPPRLALAPPMEGASTDIDAFLLEKLHAAGLAFSPPADRRTLIRRVTFDLTGLPPTPEEVTVFVADKSPAAYEKVVDRLLASPRYGERWARHWLDVARFGESHGFERDQIRENAWRYRDWVIDAFNADMPYDRFVRAQIAGDVLEPATPAGIVATGFLVCAPWDEVGQSQISTVMRARVREEEMEEMVGTVGQTFLGLTVNCARCHDHKFDPIPQADYYRLKAALDGVHPGDRPLLTAVQQRERETRQAGLRERLQIVDDALARLAQAGRDRVLKSRAATPLPETPSPMARWTFENDARDSVGGLDAHLEGGAKIVGGRLRVDGKTGFAATADLPREIRAKTLEAWVYLSDRAQRGGGAISLENPAAATFDAIVFGEREPGKWIAGSDFFRRTRDLDTAAENASPDEPVHMAIVYATDGRIQVYRNGAPYGESYLPAVPQSFPPSGSRVLFGLRHTGAGAGFLAGEIEEARLYDRALRPAEVVASYRAGVPKVSAAEIAEALTPDERAARERCAAERARLLAESDAIASPPQVYAVAPRTPGPTFVLARGDVESPGERVAAGGIAALGAERSDFGLPADASDAERRQRLADWIADPRNPLTARVMVNRLWHYHFGRGIVASPSDFGVNGDPPSHPELLDWLATEFVRSGWSVKAMQRRIVLSAAYRQSARFAPGAARVDAEDRLLWRFAPRRLEAEEVRDAMLCASGQLNEARGGPGFRPFTLTINNSHFYTLTDPIGPAFNRRSIYRIQVQSARPTLLEAFDCPDPSTKTPRRSATVTPLQALELMNNSFVLRQAKELARRAMRESGPDPDAAVSRVYRLTLGRSPNPAELAEATAFVRRDSLEGLAWALLNSSEFLYIR